jgi:uncharacterized protein YdcH (DUF465 family)
MKRSTVIELETQHRSLDQEIKRLERRGMHMTPPEQERAHELKKARLATKDRIVDMRRATG